MSLGFKGKLLQWWNNCLTEESKEDIKHAIQKDEEGTPIFDERIGKGVPDGVNTLIYTIMKHFVGKPSNITSRIYDQLSNLRCKNLGEYRWYEDVFTIRVMHRSDCNSPFWNEKFINGLPRLFDEKVKETLSTPLGVIDFDNLTYGDISSTIQSERIKMCRDLKIQSQASKSKAKYEVGNFCTQYGLPFVIPKRKSKFREKGSFKRSKKEKQQPSIIENGSLKLMISIRKESPNPQANPYPKHQENATTMVKEVISGRSVKPRPKPLSTL